MADDELLTRADVAPSSHIRVRSDAHTGRPVRDVRVVSPGDSESGVRTAVAALDREIQLHDEYRTSGESDRHQTRGCGRGGEGSPVQNIMHTSARSCESYDARCGFWGRFRRTPLSDVTNGAATRTGVDVVHARHVCGLATARVVHSNSRCTSARSRRTMLLHTIQRHDTLRLLLQVPAVDPSDNKLRCLTAGNTLLARPADTLRMRYLQPDDRSIPKGFLVIR